MSGWYVEQNIGTKNRVFFLPGDFCVRILLGEIHQSNHHLQASNFSKSKNMGGELQDKWSYTQILMGKHHETIMSR